MEEYLKYVSAQHFKHANGPYAFTNLEHRKRIQAIAKSVLLHSLSDNIKKIILQQQAASTSVNALKQAVQALFTQAKPNNANQCKQSMARTEQDQNSISSPSTCTWALGTGPTSISNGSGHVPGSKKTKETVVSLFGEKIVCKEIANFRIRLCLPGNEQCKQFYFKKFQFVKNCIITSYQKISFCQVAILFSRQAEIVGSPTLKVHCKQWLFKQKHQSVSFSALTHPFQTV